MDPLKTERESRYRQYFLQYRWGEKLIVPMRFISDYSKIKLLINRIKFRQKAPQITTVRLRR